VVNKGETVMMVGEVIPVPFLAVVDEADVEVDPATNDASLELVGVSTNPHVAGEPVEGGWEFPLESGYTSVPITYRTMLRVTGIEPLFGPTYFVYDPAELWANPADVIALTGGDFSQGQVVRAILAAQSVVGAWVSVPVQSPVPDPIRQATTFLAARALTTISSGTTGADGRIISETVGDYTVRYADPSDDGSGGGGGVLPLDIAALLAPYHSRVGMTKVGPPNPRIPLPVVIDTTLIADGWWYEDVVIYDEEYP
jgi:hypothetical protein